MTRHFREAWCGIDLAVLRTNLGHLQHLAAPAHLLVDLSADGFGHGALHVARAARRVHGVAGFAVGLVEEALQLRAGGITAPIVVNEPPVAAVEVMVTHHLVASLSAASSLFEFDEALVGRLGRLRVIASGEESNRTAVRSAAHLRHPHIELIGAYMPGPPGEGPWLTSQEVFDAAIASVPHAPPGARDAGRVVACRNPTVFRAGIAAYGAPRTASGPAELRPVLDLKARVSHVQRLEAGTPISYGLRYRLPDAGTVATVPLGYADGIPRRLGETAGEVLIHGRRCPIAGAVTMDQFMIDAGALSIESGDEVVVLGRQGRDEISIFEWADRLTTVPEELLCRLRPRIQRRYAGGSGDWSPNMRSQNGDSYTVSSDGK